MTFPRPLLPLLYSLAAAVLDFLRVKHRFHDGTRRPSPMKQRNTRNKKVKQSIRKRRGAKESMRVMTCGAWHKWKWPLYNVQREGRCRDSECLSMYARRINDVSK